MEVITNLIAVIISQYIGVPHIRYTLRLYTAMYQLYLSKAGKKDVGYFKKQKEERKREGEIRVQFTRKNFSYARMTKEKERSFFKIIYEWTQEQATEPLLQH